MLNVAGKNASDRVIPVRMPAAQGFEYVHRHVRMGNLPPPSVIYIDTAHTYPEMSFELDAAWALLRPGGFLTGDDYTHYFPPVQQALNEWVSRQPPGSFAPPAQFANGWGSVQKMRLVRVLTPGDEANASAPLAPFVLRLPGQWVLRKPHRRPSAGSAALTPSQAHSDRISSSLQPMRDRDESPLSQASLRAFSRRMTHRPLSCCLNGWANPDPEPLCSVTPWVAASADGATGQAAPRRSTRAADALSIDEHQPRVKQQQTRAEKLAVAECVARARQGGPYYTRCRPDALPLQQETCNLPSQRTKCVTNFRCREIGHAIGGGGGRGRGMGRGGRGKGQGAGRAKGRGRGGLKAGRGGGNGDV